MPLLILLRKQYHIILLITIIFYLYVKGSAAEDTTITFGPEEVLARSLHNNSAVQTALRTAQFARIELMQARANFLPSLNAASSTISKSVQGTKVPYKSNDIGIQTSANLTLFDGFVNVFNLQKMHCAWMASVSSSEAKRQEIIYSVITRYIQVFLDSEIVHLDEENLNYQIKLLHKIEAFKNAGQKPIGDLYSQKVIVSSSDLLLSNARQNYNSGKIQLLRIMNDDSLSTNFKLRQPFFDSIKISLMLKSDLGLTNIIDSRKDISSRIFSVKASVYQVGIARSSWWPTLSVSADATTGYSSLTGDTRYNQLTDINVKKSFGLNLSIPLFDRLSTVSAVSKAKLQLEQDRADLMDLKNQVISEVKQAMLTYQTACDQIKTTSNELSAAKLALSAAESRYDADALTLSELTSAQTLYQTALNDNTIAIYAAMTGIVSIGYSAGAIDRIIDFFM